MDAGIRTLYSIYEARQAGAIRQHYESMLVLSLRERGTNSVVLFSAAYALFGTLDAIYECESCVKLQFLANNELASSFSL